LIAQDMQHGVASKFAWRYIPARFGFGAAGRFHIQDL
jgi:hypothetical protein